MPKVAIFESNLLWSVRLRKNLGDLGFQAEVFGKGSTPDAASGFDAAIVNLADANYPVADLVTGLRELGVKVIGHAGHKEKELHQLGRDIGCDLLATNSQLTHKLGWLLEQLALA